MTDKEIEDYIEPMSDDEFAGFHEKAVKSFFDMAETQLLREEAERQILENNNMSDASDLEKVRFLDNYVEKETASLIEAGVPEDQIDDYIYGKDETMDDDEYD
ncbi:MAG: hypothetical protein LBL44_03005 [Treponema sp.]|jgi:hypothetical protein|nr:hypothetical protein [Treponema sp.]